jgi:hypothetical protein
VFPETAVALDTHGLLYTFLQQHPYVISMTALLQNILLSAHRPEMTR